MLQLLSDSIVRLSLDPIEKFADFRTATSALDIGFQHAIRFPDKLSGMEVTNTPFQEVGYRREDGIVIMTTLAQI